MKHYTVSAVNQVMSNVFMQHELLGHFLYLQAEVSSCKTASSGHCYLTLKDENAEIAAVM